MGISNGMIREYTDTSRFGGFRICRINIQIIFTDSAVYYYGEQSISRHNINTGKLELRLRQKDNKSFTGMFVTPKNTFINVSSEGLYRLESDTLFRLLPDISQKTMKFFSVFLQQ